jgi:acyl-CoA synthetase (NDP forming)
MATAISSSARARGSAAADLRPLLGAESVAIVGASDRNYYTRSVFENLLVLGFPRERIVLVNPNRPDAFGTPCVARLDRAVDVAVVATPKGTVPGVVRDLAAVGTRSCVILSDGFAESGPEGARLQAEVAAAAGPMLLVGPNTMGVIVPGARLGLWGARLPALRDGSVATVFQSSGLTNLFVHLLAQRRIGLRAAISVGNEAGLRLADHLGFLVDDPAVRVIVTFIESVTDGRTFRAALERADEAGKAVIALRVGRSDRGQRNVAAHTGKLATPGAAWDALLAQTGVIAVGNVDELLETTALLTRPSSAPLRADGVALVTISGGDCTLLADLAARVGVALVEPRERARLAEIVGKPAVLGDPLDVEDLLRTDRDGFYRAVEVLARDEQVGILGVRLNLPDRPTAELRESYRRVVEIARTRGVLPVLLSRASESLDAEWYALFEELGVPFVREYEKGLRAIASLVAFRARQAAPRKPRAKRFHASPAYSLPRGEGPVTHRQAAALLRPLRIPLARTEIAASADEAVAAADRLGYPAVVKADVPHKSDLGAVRVDLRDAAAVRAAYGEVVGRAPGRDVLVQRMERGMVEALVGLSRDPELGPVITVGIGGAFVEVLRDVSLRLPPITETDAREMIEGLRGARMFDGIRGRPPADVDALVRVILSLATADLVGIGALDLNPVIVRAQGEGVVAVDVLVERSAS